MTVATTVSPTHLSYEELQKLSEVRLQHIAAIKDEVAQDTSDNLEQPQPLFEQLQTQG